MDTKIIMNIESNWSLGTVVYHLYVRSFKDSNSDGIGDLQGLIQKIDYIASLGINAIWLSPIYPSPQFDFGYDVADYKDIDPVYGSLAIFDQFVAACHERGIKIMMDFVPNHTSVDHSWFKESRKSKDNDKRDWYIWKKGKDEGPPNNWLSVFGGTGWEYDEITDEYYLHTFDKNQPDLNWRNPEVVKEMLSYFDFWIDRGVDGFRVDVPYHLFKDSEFRDEPPNPNYNGATMGMYESLQHIHTAWLPESFLMMKQFTKVLQKYEDKFMVTEAWGSIEDLIKLYNTVGWKYYAPFNFSLITLPWTAEAHKNYIDTYDKELGDTYIPCYVLGNHDTPRVASRIGHEQAKVAAMCQLSLRGMPFIYMGEEIGMENAVLQKEEIRDTFEINSPGLGLGRDPQRTPMQWDQNAYAEFTDTKPWLPVNDNYSEINVRQQTDDKESTLSFYKHLIKVRKHFTPLREGSYIPLASPAENVLLYLRQSNDEKVLVILNFDEKSKMISLPEFSGKIICDSLLLSREGEHVHFDKYDLQSNEGIIVLLDTSTTTEDR
jgi:alpha-glucosidase